jgi:Bacterial archaeo-eukaryotic release factor family 7
VHYHFRRTEVERSFAARRFSQRYETKEEVFLVHHMVAINSSAVQLMDLGTIREILLSPGPCITVLLPTYRPGEPAGSPATLLKANIQEAAKQLAEGSLPRSAIASLLEPLQNIAEDPSFAAGSHWGRAIFRSLNVFRQFYLTNATGALLTVGGCFAIRHLAPELSRPRVFYVLALSKTHVALLRCEGLHAEIASLPPGVPETLTEALALKPPDHDLEGRSAAGASTGAMHSVRFGTGSGRERQQAHLADYYKLVDRGLQQILREPGIPLILAGVEEDVAIYRGGSTYPGLAKRSISGSPDIKRDQIHILQQAYSILRTDAIERQRAALLAAKERTAPPGFLTDPDTILPATFEGRVRELYLNERAEKTGVFERGAYQSCGQEDLLNLAAVQTIIHHGKACSLPAEMMPGGLAAIGIMRF